MLVLRSIYVQVLYFEIEIHQNLGFKSKFGFYANFVLNQMLILRSKFFIFKVKK